MAKSRLEVKCSGYWCIMGVQGMCFGQTDGPWLEESVWTSQEASDFCPEFANHAQLTVVLGEWIADLLAVFLHHLSVCGGSLGKLAPFT